MQPVVARSVNGFWAGPACDRVAVVDFSVEDGSLRPVAELDPKGSQYRNVGLYDVPTPTVPRGGAGPWARGAKISLDELSAPDGDTGFIKVSVFGTVIRTIAFVEDPVVLGRPVEWAFGGRQILVVPCAGTLDNAFYHRPSRSLQFFSYDAPDSGRRLHTALSQDIVTHETAHALVDGIAPDLYDAVSPESLAIHESAADITAAMISLRSRDPARGRPTPAEAIDAVVRSSRYSRIAEEFGRSRGQGDALRDAINDRTLNPRARTSARVVDRLSPHSLSEVLTGAIFSVLVSALTETLTLIDAGRDVPEIRCPRRNQTCSGSQPATRSTGWGACCSRGSTGSRPARRPSLTSSGPCSPPTSSIIPTCPTSGPCSSTRAPSGTSPPEPSWTPLLGMRPATRSRSTSTTLRTGAKPSRRFVKRHRDRLGVPAGPVDVRSSISVRFDEPLLQLRHTREQVALERAYPHAAETDRIVLVKASWWESQPVTLPGAGATSCDIRMGVSAALDAEGRLRALLRTSRDNRAMAGRQEYLRRLADSAVLLAPGDDLGPDGEPLRARVPTTVSDGRLRVIGAFHALHIADAG